MGEKKSNLHTPSVILGVIVASILLSLSWFLGYNAGGAGPPGKGAGDSSPLLNEAANLVPVLPLAENTIANIAEKASKSVVNIDIRQTRMVEPPLNYFFPGFAMPSQGVKQEVKGTGSGIIIKENGYILTNNHVAGSANQIKVTLSDKREFKGKVVGRDALTDLAVIKIEAKDLPVARLGTSKSIRPGDWAIAIGSPMGLDHTVTLGIISALGRSLSDLYDLELIQTDAAINTGNSGGPLLNVHGDVIGLNAAVQADAQNIGFAIPVDSIKDIAEILITHGKIARPYVGIRMQEVDAKLASALGVDSNTEGVVVMSVQPGSPAEKAELAQGDIIQRLDGEKVRTGKQVQKLVRKHNPGDAIPFLILREKKLLPVDVKVSEFPTEPGE
ncbi:MAG: trypsin-like peptidase domain-containing protein [Candidatus Obscuribacterales bacterium]|nr:trypsin-like peptidase domain-containing protein [Candidatus Obscuribacterales bacterium]